MIHRRAPPFSAKAKATKIHFGPALQPGMHETEVVLNRTSEESDANSVTSAVIGQSLQCRPRVLGL